MYNWAMRQNIKRLLQLLTIIFVGLFVIAMVASFALGGSTGYLGVVQIIAAPFESLILLILWVAYITSPSISKSISGKDQVATSNHKSAKANAGVSAASRILAWISLLAGLLGLLLLGWFAYVCGPNQGVGHHVFGGSNRYMDMQVGIASLLVGALCAVINHIAIRGSET